MHRLIKTTFRESLTSNRRCFWVSGTDATKPVTTIFIPHHLPKFPTFPGFLPAPASGPDLLCLGLELPKTRGHSQVLIEQCWTQPPVSSCFLKYGLLTKRK